MRTGGAADEQLAELLKTQKSLTEWLEDIQHKDAEALRVEDNLKRERLSDLNQLINLPFDKPVQFEASAIAQKTKEFQIYFKKHNQDLCALRLLPKKTGLPKLRMRGKTVEFACQWFNEQDINPEEYRADFVPHPPDYGWSTIFIVNQHGIQGEIIFGGHHLLTQGFHEKVPPILFRFDFQKWSLSPENNEALHHLRKLAAHLYVPDPKKRALLTKKLQATFAHNYLEGYFETTDSSVGTWFIDYNRVLGKMYADTIVQTAEVNKGRQVLLTGKTGSRGRAEGPVRLVSPDKLEEDFPSGSVLVCAMTTPNYVPLMKRASAIVTDQGGILSHAAIIARELKKPCIVATGKATQVLHDNDHIVVDADNGLVAKP